MAFPLGYWARISLFPEKEFYIAFVFLSILATDFQKQYVHCIAGISFLHFNVSQIHLCCICEDLVYNSVITYLNVKTDQLRHFHSLRYIA